MEKFCSLKKVSLRLKYLFLIYVHTIYYKIVLLFFQLGNIDPLRVDEINKIYKTAIIVAVCSMHNKFRVVEVCTDFYT